MQPISLTPVDSLTVTTLVDNVTDMLLVDEGPAKRPPTALSGYPSVPARFLEGGRTGDALRAEHGFSCLVTATASGRSIRVLFDAGRTPDGLVENMRRLEISPREIDVIVLSHGHWDHTTGMDGFARELGRANLPVLIHPEFWSRRRLALPGRDPVELPSTSRRALEGAGFEIVEDRQPSFLFDGSLLVTGEVDRTTEFEQGFPFHEAYRHARWQPDPLILDDQALAATVRGAGLVILTGCGHSGIVNIVRYVRRLTGDSRRIHPDQRRDPLRTHLGTRLTNRFAPAAAVTDRRPFEASYERSERLRKLSADVRSGRGPGDRRAWSTLRGARVGPRSGGRGDRPAVGA